METLLYLRVCDALRYFSRRDNHHQLQNRKITIYLGNQSFLRPNHPYRRLQKDFNGEQEFDFAQNPLIGNEVIKDNNALRLSLERN